MRSSIHHTAFARAAGRAVATTAAVMAALCALGGTPRAAASDGASDDAGATAGAAQQTETARRDWVGTWATALTAASAFDTGRSLSGFENESIRMIVQTSIGGALVRVRLSNRYGDRALTIGHASVARPATPSAPQLDPRTVRTLSFAGKPAVTVPAGAEVLSDPVPMFLPPLSQLAVTLYLPQPTGPVAWHWFSRQTAFVYDSDHATDVAGDGATMTLEHFYVVASVEVRGDRRDGAVVVLGDSISDGPFLPLNANHRWPDFLAQQISIPRRGARELGVLNLALSGNAATHDGTELGLPELGPSGLNRLGEHVFVQAGVRTVIVEQGLNDIFQHDETPEAIIAGLQQIAADLRQRGLRVLLGTLVPATGDPKWTDVREATRQAVNQYVRTTCDADGVVDFDVALRDPANPARLNPAFDRGDHVHPNEQGNMAIAAIVPVSLL